MKDNNVNEKRKMALFLMVVKNEDGNFAIQRSSVTSTHKGNFEGFVQKCGNKYGVDEKIPEGAILKYIFPDRKSIPSDIAVGMTGRNMLWETAKWLKDQQDNLDLQFTVFSIDMGATPIVSSSSIQDAIMSSLEYEDWEKANKTGTREGFRAKYREIKKIKVDNTPKREEKTNKQTNRQTNRQAKAYIPEKRRIPAVKKKNGRTL